MPSTEAIVSTRFWPSNSPKALPELPICVMRK